jgi:hypothetical protein
MTHIPYETPGVPAELSAPKTGLMVFGIIMIIMGSLAGCFAILTPLSLVMMSLVPAPQRANVPQSLEYRSIIASGMMYLLFSVALTWTGIGSVRARRWVPPVVKSVCTIVLVAGIIFTIATAWRLPRIGTVMQMSMSAARAPSSAPSSAAAGTPSLPPPPAVTAVSSTVTAIAITAGVLVAVLFYIVIPGVFLWYYRKESVRNAVEFFDSHPRWTDGVPMPVMILGMCTLISGVWLLFPAITGLFPAFGTYIRGTPALVIWIVLGVIQLLAALGMFKMKMGAWFLAIGTLTVLTASALMTALRVDPDTYYQMMQISDEQREILRAAGTLTPTSVAVMGILTYTLFLGFALYALKSLRRAAALPGGAGEIGSTT